MSFFRTIAKGLMWSTFEKFSVQLIQFVIGIILARLLTPAEYGIIGILLVLIALLQVFIDSGFSKALIQKQDRTQVDYSTVFFINGVISVICYTLLWFAAPFIATFYNTPSITEYIRVIGLVLFFNALFAVPNTILTVRLDFRMLAQVNLAGNLISGIVAIIMAYFNYGVWSLIWQQIIRAMVLVCLSWFFLRWKPMLVFSWDSYRQLFTFGSSLLYASLLNMAVNNFANLFIAKLSNTRDLGYYTRGTQFTDVVYGTTSAVLESVLFPLFAKSQGDLPLLVRHFQSLIRYVSILIVPVFFLLAFLAEPLVLVILTEKWLPVVPIMQIFCFARIITIIAGLNVTVLYAIGRSKLVLKQQYAKIIVRVIFLLMAMQFGIVYIAIAELASTLVHFFINTYYPGKIMKAYSIMQLKQILPAVISGAVMLLTLWCIGSLMPMELDLIYILFAVAVGLTTYIYSLKMFNLVELTVIETKIKDLLKTIK